MEMQTQRADLWTWGGLGWGGSRGCMDVWRCMEMYGERSMEVYMTICKIDSQWEFAV